MDVRDAESVKILVEEPGAIGAGGNSGFQALNLAVQFGAMRILLVGFDMHMAAGVHWHGDHGKGLNNPRDHNFMKWRRTFDKAARTIRDIGVDVVNASLDSALTAFPKMTVEQAMERWGYD